MIRDKWDTGVDPKIFQQLMDDMTTKLAILTYNGFMTVSEAMEEMNIEVGLGQQLFIDVDFRNEIRDKARKLNDSDYSITKRQNAILLNCMVKRYYLMIRNDPELFVKKGIDFIKTMVPLTDIPTNNNEQQGTVVNVVLPESLADGHGSGLDDDYETMTGAKLDG